MTFSTKWLSVFVAPAALLGSISFAASPTIRQVSIAQPTTNMSVDFQASDTRLLYTQSDPLMGNLPKCVSCGDAPFKAFHMRFYLARLRNTGGQLAVSTPRQLFTEGIGIDVAPYSIQGGWIVYLRYHSYDVQSGQYWNLVARNVRSGAEVMLDSPQQENLPSFPSGASSDGHTVVWASWTQGTHGRTSVIRTYSLHTGQRAEVVRGGTTSTWSYSRPVISGNLIVLERDAYGRGPGDYAHQSSRVLLINRTTHQTRTLTPGHVFQSEPSISGQVVVWKDGAAGSQARGVEVMNLKTGSRKKLVGFDAEGPRAVGGRYAVFPYANRTNESAGYTIQAYDTVTGTSRTVFRHHGLRGTGNGIRASQHVVVFQTGTPKNSAGQFQSRLTVVRLP